MPDLPKVPVWALFFIVYVVLGVFVIGPMDRFAYFMGGAMMLVIWLMFEVEAARD